MLEVLERTVSITRCLVSSFDAAALSGVDARAAVEAFVELEKLAAAGKIIAAGRLDETGAWNEGGAHRDIEAFMAATSGTSVGAARGSMKTARRVKEQPKVVAALRRGELSPVQAEAVSAAVNADPNAVSALLGAAKTAGFKGLKTECDRVTAAAASRESEAENYEQIHANRALRHTTKADGSGHITINGPLDRTAAIMAALEPLERELFEQNRKSREAVYPDAVAFDAMVAMAERFTHGHTTGDVAPSEMKIRRRGSRPLAMIVVHVSKAAYERGWTERGEICEIEGSGPIPVSVARQLASDSIMKAVVIDGVDVRLVAHLGRTISAHLRTAIEVRDRTCVIEGCEVDRHLQIDHNIPVATGGPTALENLARVCHHHHFRKTVHDLRRAGPLGRQKLVTKAEFVASREPDP